MIEEVEAAIRAEAARLANRDLPSELEGKGHIFRPGVKGLSLMHEPLPWLTEAESARMLPQLRQLAVSSVKQAINAHKREFAALIISEAKQGRNYFDRFHAN